MNYGPPYKRRQVQTALWSVFSGNRGGAVRQKPFNTRIKHLVDIDSGRQQIAASSLPRYAFSDSGPQGKGADVAYMPLDAFCIAIGLDLLDLGFKQQEAVFFLKHIRPNLADAYRHIMRQPPSPRQRIQASERPGCPSYMDNGLELADCRLYLVFDKVELTELFPSHPAGIPLISQPVFLQGIDALRDFLHTRSHELRKAVVIEIANLAVLVTEALQSVPPSRRGRGAS